MATLRDLLTETSYKAVFNCLYKNFYQNKDYSKSDIVERDLAYHKVVKSLIRLPSNPKPNLKIYLASIGADCDIDVCLLDEIEDSLFSLDFVAWEDIIDMEIFNTVKISYAESLAYILWEITFWGFSQEQIKKQKQITIDAANEK